VADGGINRAGGSDVGEERESVVDLHDLRARDLQAGLAWVYRLNEFAGDKISAKTWETFRTNHFFTAQQNFDVHGTA